MAQLNDLIVNGNTRFIDSAFGNLVGSASTALYAPTNSHDHNYKLSAETAEMFISGGISLSANGSNISITTGDHKILISAKNDWTANDLNKAGYVAAPTSSNKNQVWKTDANGKPGWKSESFQATGVMTPDSNNTSSYKNTTAMFSGLSAINAIFAHSANVANISTYSYYNFGINFNSAAHLAETASLVAGSANQKRLVIIGQDNSGISGDDNTNNKLNVTDDFELDNNQPKSNPYVLIGNWNSAGGNGVCIGVKGIAYHGGITLGVAPRSKPASAIEGSLSIKGQASYGSFALGDTTASCSSISLGYQNNTNSGAISMGQQNTVETSSIGIGLQNSVNNGSLAIGFQNNVKNGSLAIGSQNVASAGSLAIGTSSRAVEQSISFNAAIAESGSLAFGSATTASNGSLAFNGGLATNVALAFGNSTATDQSFAIGQGSTARNNSFAADSGFANQGSIAYGTSTASAGSFSFGSDNIAINSSFAVGLGLRVSNYGAAFGKYNIASTDKYLVVGNGTNNSTRKNVFFVDANGCSAVKFSGTINSALHYTPTVTNNVLIFG